MAARQLGRRAAVPAVLLAGSLLAPRTTVYAESPSEIHQVLRKPIYDDDVPIRNTAPLPTRPKEATPLRNEETTLEGKLAPYVRTARRFAAAHVGLAEDSLNRATQRFFEVENGITSTIAGLAPDPTTTGERVMPGLIYVVVAGMAGQIVTRRRNILFRAAAPVVFAVAAGEYLLPHTTRNVADLLWTWEQRFPALADGHIRARQALDQAGRDARQATHDARAKIDDTVTQARTKLESWIQKGK